MTQPRIIVTGNRDWTCRRTITRWLPIAFDLACDKCLGRIGPALLIHGACGKRGRDGKAIVGADVFAHDIAVEWGWDTEPHPAAWALYGNAAGPRRNEDMAKLGAHIGLAFGELARKGKRTGTGDMVDRMAAHGIPYIHIARPLS